MAERFDIVVAFAGHTLDWRSAYLAETRLSLRCARGRPIGGGGRQFPRSDVCAIPRNEYLLVATHGTSTAIRSSRR